MRKKGVNLRLGYSVDAFEGEERIRQAVLSNGETSEADFILLGIGVIPASKFLKDINLNDDGSIAVNKHLIHLLGNLSKFNMLNNFLAEIHVPDLHRVGNRYMFYILRLELPSIPCG